ncbi:MAG: Lrp/AsnC family transcriptional regulator [Spirochaetales bacterium]|nr:Lrp/AsnC family transcriptional regulator [Spirochaetales bacterium]MCF7938066.1 Lrp/AsnC family transcriptional regulator [Spirochaetales bacterium]
MARKKSLTLFDKLDYRIINALHQDARMSASKMARLLEEKERTVRKRIDRLIEMGVGRATFVVEPTAFGYGIAVDIFLDIEQEKEEDILDQLLGFSQISYIAYGQGTNDLSLEARFKTSEEMYEFLRRVLPGIEGVKVKEFALVPRILRNIDEWTPPCDNFENC